jgi:hypothetical protein
MYFLMWCNQVACGAVAREAAIGIGSKPAGIRPTIYGDALIDCGIAAFDQLKPGIGKIECLSDLTTQMSSSLLTRCALARGPDGT